LISKYFYTIFYIKFKQIYYRIWFYLTKPRINKKPFPKLRVSKNKLCQTIPKKQSLININTFKFLNKSNSLLKVSWNGNKNLVSKLWLYNLHYFDDLNAIDYLKRKALHKKLLIRWIDENKIGKGVGWESYPTSLRIVNWIKWSFLGNKLSDYSLKSLALQAQWLTKRIEWHLLGNHLFSNAKALVFAGLFFSNKESENWLKKGLKIIDTELNEQILNDGGNFERSPMYHSIFLEDILDLINISKKYPEIIEKRKVDEWCKVSKKMLRWLETMAHPDGNIAFFNDSALEIAPNLNELKKYAQRLGINYSFVKFSKVTHLTDSGYIRLTSNNIMGLLDVAPIGPDYLTGHAHADTLSFELSLFGQRLIVNSGTSEYEIGPAREHERSTKAHNTVVVNDENSSEMWGAFRVARRAYPYNLEVKELKNFVNISCEHNGYKRLANSPIHRRNWQFSKNSLIINDHISNTCKSAIAYLHFHPSVIVVENKKNTLILEMPGGQKIIVETKKGKPLLKKSYFAPEFGKKLDSQCLKISLDKKKTACVQISWNY
jgi:uncharacterized heparinase superfamily protein